MKILYFAWVRQKIGRGEEHVDLPAQLQTARDLALWLRARGDGYAQAFNDLARIRVAINEVHAGLEAHIQPNDEIAFFPPVTGG